MELAWRNVYAMKCVDSLTRRAFTLVELMVTVSIIGLADAINTNDQRHVGVVVKVEPRHQFENGAITEGWLMRADDGTEVWFVRTNLANSELVWRKAPIN
jgi:prepilin-type N-terminal cleavage/methylation domain-containing protein